MSKDVDHLIIWNTLKNDLPEFKKSIESNNPRKKFALIKTLAIIFCAGFLFFISASHASAAIKYVALDGNDSADGSLATPWASIEYAIEDGGINGGDTLQLMCNTNGSGSPCVYDATNFWKSGSDKVITKSVTGGTLTLQQYVGMNVTLNWPSDSAANTMLLTGTWVFDHLNFTNTNAVAQYLVKMYHGGSDITFQDGLIDQGRANHSMFYLNPSTTGYFTLNRMKVTNTTSQALIEIFPVGGASTIVTRFLSSVFYNTGWLYTVTYPGYANDLYMYNNTFVNGTYRYKFWNLDNNGVRDFRNNIFRGDQTFYEPIFSNNATSIDPAKWTVKHNIFYITGLADPSPGGKAGEYLAILNNGQFPLDETNYFIDPQFSNEVIGKATGGSSTTLVDSTVDFTTLGLVDGMTVINTNTGVSSAIATGGITAHTITLATTCAFSANNFYHILKSNSYIPTNTYIDGRGDVSVLPVGGDSNGHAWTGADIGAVYNPGSLLVMPSITANTIACLGDSTSQGLCNQISSDNALSPIAAVGTGIMGAAIGGTLGEGLKWFVDRAATTWHPQYVVLLSWNNNFNSGSVTPTNLTYQQAADDTMIAVKKAKYWGMIPIVLNMGGSVAATTASQVAQSNTLGPLLETGCIANDVSYGNPLERMRFNPNFANVYSSSGTEGYYQAGGLASNVHPASAGYKLMYSVVKDLLAGHQNTIYITQTGTSIVGSQYGAGTTLYPLSVVGLNAQTVGGGYVDLPMGVAGQTISASGAFSTTLVTPSAGASGRLLSLIGGTWQAGVQLAQSYWKMLSGVITGKDSSNNSLTISGANVEADNLSISGSTSSGINVTENTTLKNIAVKESSGTSMTIASGKTVTGNNNCFYSSAASGLGTYTDGGYTQWSCNPLFTSSSDLFPLSNSPLINTGAVISGITSDYAGTAIPQGSAPEIGAYEFQDTTPPSAFSLSSPTNNTWTANTSPTLSWSATTDSGTGLAKYQLYINDTLNKDNISSATTSTTPTSSLTEGTYTWYIKAIDNNSNSTQSIETFTIKIDTTAPTNIGLTSITPTSATELTILAQTATDAGVGLHATPYFFHETSGNSGASDSSYQASTTYSDTGLSPNTEYTYQVKAKDANTNESAYSATLSKYTLAATPTTLTATTITTHSITLTTDTFPNATTGLSGYYFLNTNTGATSGWITTNSWTDQNVLCSSSYPYSIKYRNADGTETSTLSLNATSTTCVNGGGSYVYPPILAPTVPETPAVVPAPVVVTPAPIPQEVAVSSPPEAGGVPASSGGGGLNLGTTTLKFGSKGEPVKTLQQFLNQDLKTKLIVDGKLGRKTITVIKQWQKMHGLVADGVVGKKTRGKMME
jgi:hypothetical protein